MALAYISLNDWAFFVALGVAPSLIWLWYYLKKDEHPEPKLMILKAFIFGFISTFLAFGLEFLFMKTVLGDGSACPECKYDLPKMLGLSAGKDFFILSFVFLGVLAYIEEAVKYLAAKISALRSKAFDEPVDAMVYLVVAALGFAAAENIGYILQDMENAVGIAYFRFLSSTFIHALASAVAGYFFAFAVLRRKNVAFYAALGLIFATAIHAMFNAFIVLAEGNSRFLILVAILIASASITVSFLFAHIKKLSLNEQRN